MKKAPKSSIKIHCSYDRLVPIEELKPHPKNRNTHSEAQVDRIITIFGYQGIRKAAVISNRSGYLTTWHGRLQAAKRMKLKTIPVNFQDYDSDEQEIADLVADNAIASWATLDYAAINLDLPDLGPDFEVDYLGIENFELEPADKYYSQSNGGSSGTQEEGAYTKKIEPPIYEVKGVKPSISELFDRTKYNKILQNIKRSDLDPETKTFLSLAATRHIIFDYRNIAEFYAHSPAEAQKLMEESALVIIDFNKAIENGFVELSKEIAEHYEG